jgi:hypothetical protein
MVPVCGPRWLVWRVARCNLQQRLYIEAVLESIGQLRELRSELFLSKQWKDVHSEIAEYGLQDIMLPRNVNAKMPSRYSYVTQQRGLKTAPPPTFHTAEDHPSQQNIALSVPSPVRIDLLLQ